MNVQQNEFTSFKLLLKQVYSVHTSKVRELENEVKLLKEKLIEKVREPENVSDCKRCVELEEAFKSCKKSLHEQSKWFESFGQKFSIFNGTEQEIQDLKIPVETPNCKSEATKTCKNVKTEINCVKNEPPILSLEESISNKSNAGRDSATSTNQNLLKNVMTDNGGLDTLDVYTVTFPPNHNSDTSNRKSDFAILAPDSLDIDQETKKGVKRASTETIPEERNNKKASNHKESENCEKNKVAPKRLSFDSLNEKLKKCHNSDRLQDDYDVTKSTTSKVDHTITQKNVLSSIETKHVAGEKSKGNVTFKMLSDSSNKQRLNKSDGIEDDSDITKSITTKFDHTITQKSVLPVIETKHVAGEKSVGKSSIKMFSDSSNKDKLNKCDGIEDNSDITKSTNGKADDAIQKSDFSNIGNKHKANGKSRNTVEEKNVQIPKKKKDVLEVATSNEKTNVTQKNNSIIDVKKISSPYETSPSLLPMNVNPVPKIIDLESVSNDDDFVEHVSSNKPVSSDDSWDTCDKKKTVRRKPVLKSIKSTSKFKMTLDAPSVNYRKPSYKQVKLSKSFFHGKKVKDGSFKDKIMEKSKVAGKGTIPKKTEKESFPICLEDFQTSTSCDDLKSPNPVDIDATFIPENYNYEVTPCGTSAVKRNAVEKSNFRNGSLFANISFPGKLKTTSDGKDSDIEEVAHSPSFEDVELKENMDSFDKLPVPEEPNYKYKNDVVRKKSERKQLNAFDCLDCERYYSDLGLTHKEKKERMKKCSRHRAKFAPPATPDHFWELDFPDTQECKARGYMNETQKVKLNNLCDI